jgi:hypothetical protein
VVVVAAAHLLLVETQRQALALAAMAATEQRHLFQDRL